MDAGGNNPANVLVRLWRGECGLGRTYWLFGWMVAAICVGANALLSGMAQQSPGAAWGIASFAAGVIYLAYLGAWTVGLGRAARMYKGRRALAILAVLMAGASWCDVVWSYWSGSSPSGIPPMFYLRFSPPLF